LVKTFEPAAIGTVYQLHCPMVFGGKGAIWLQCDKQVSNPYFGTAMLKCADRAELIFSLPVRSTQTGGKTKEQKEGRQVQHLEVPAEFQSKLVKLWEEYLSLQQALSRDDPSLALQTISDLQTTLWSIDAGPLTEDAHKVWKKEYANLVQILQSMSLSEGLISIREIFPLLSDELVILIKTFGPAGFGTVYQLHCPMVFGGKGAIWLQGDKQAKNPYYGKAMLKCADRAELIFSLPVRSLSASEAQAGTQTGGKTKEQKEERQSQHPEVPAEFQLQLVKLWKGYLSLQQALSDNELSLAHQAIADIQTTLLSIDAGPLAEDAHKGWKKENDNLVQILQSMSQSEDLKSIRKNFSSLSDELMVLVKTFKPSGFGTVYQLHCPMAFGGKGAIWLQGDKQVKNPYLGTAMQKCSDRVELISDLPASDAQAGTQTGGKVEDHKGEHHHEQ